MPRHQSPPHNTWAAQKSTFWPFLAPHRRAERSGNRAAPAPTPGAWLTRSAPGPPGAPRGLPRSRSRCLSRAAPRLHTHPGAPGPLHAAPRRPRAPPGRTHPARAARSRRHPGNGRFRRQGRAGRGLGAALVPQEGRRCGGDVLAHSHSFPVLFGGWRASLPWFCC